MYKTLPSSITVIGTGYVGLVTALSFVNHTSVKVCCLDTDENKINSLCKGIPTIYEPNIESNLSKALADNKINFTSSYEVASKSQIIFICVGTPTKQDGVPNLDYFHSALRSLAPHIEENAIIVNKSTLPIGSIQSARTIIKESMSAVGISKSFHIISNPEFLREGSAFNDFIDPDRVVIGTDNFEIASNLVNLYIDAGISKSKILLMNPESAELTKYAANAFLAMKISFINEFAYFCDHLNANIKDVAKGIGADSRIGKDFLNAGLGFGGSCFPKDIDALIHYSKSLLGYDFELLNQVREINKLQVIRSVKKINTYFQKNSNLQKIVSVLGLAFKPNTNDVRETQSAYLIKELQSLGFKINAFDPIAIEDFKKSYNDLDISFSEAINNSLFESSALIITTEWEEYTKFDSLMGSNHNIKAIFDLRNALKPEDISKIGIDYFGVGISS